MKNLERILWIVVTIALLMKIERLPLSGFLLIVALTLLSMLYLGFSWLLLPRPERKDQSVGLSIVTGLALGIACLGVLFKLQLWPLSAFYLIIATVSLFSVIIAVSFMRSDREHLALYFRGILRRAIPMCVVCIGLYFLPAGTLTAFYYRDRQDIAPLMIRLHTSKDPVEREQLRLQVDSIEKARMDQ